MTVRKITQAELEEWAQMRSRLWPGDDHRPAILRYFQGKSEDPSVVMLAVADDQVVMGHIELSVRLDFEQSKYGFIEGLYVKPEFRGGAVYREIIKAALRWSASNGFLSVLADRGPRLYEIPYSGRPRLVQQNITEGELHRQYPLMVQQHIFADDQKRGVEHLPTGLLSKE